MPRKESALRKKQILLAAQEVFSEKGLVKANVAEIAERAQVADSVLYHYFKNKEDLLFWCLAESIRELYSELSLHLEGISGAIPKLEKLIWFHLYINDRSPKRIRIINNLLFECRANMNFYSHEAYEMLRDYVRIFRGILREGVEEGVFLRDINLELVGEMIWGLLDEEALSCVASHEVGETLPDLPSIIDLISAMIFAEKPNDKRSAQTKDKKLRILQAACQVFAEKGRYGGTIAEIAKRANVAEGTIYTYFKTKDDLLFSIPQTFFEELEKEIPDIFHLKDPFRKLRRMIRFSFTVLLADRNFLKLFLLDNKLNKDFYTSGAYHAFSRYLSLLDGILEEGKKTGVFRKKVNTRVFRNLFVGALCHMAARWFILGRSGGLDIIQEIEEIVYLLCRAVVPGEILTRFQIGSLRV